MVQILFCGKINGSLPTFWRHNKSVMVLDGNSWWRHRHFFADCSQHSMPLGQRKPKPFFPLCSSGYLFFENEILVIICPKKKFTLYIHMKKLNTMQRQSKDNLNNHKIYRMQKMQTINLGGKKMEEMLFNYFMGYLLEALSFPSSQGLSLKSDWV
jgi:hypothetical protein